MHGNYFYISVYTTSILIPHQTLVLVSKCLNKYTVCFSNCNKFMFRYSKNLKHAENKRIDEEKNAESKAKVNNVNHDNDIGNNKACNGITEFFPFTTYKIINTRVLTSHLGETASQNIIFRAPNILAVILHASQSI